MNERDANTDYFDSIFDALDDTSATDTTDGSRTPAGDGAAPFQLVDDAFVADEAIRAALESHVALFAREGDRWTGMPCSFGCRYAEVAVSRANGLVRVSVDTGIRIPAHRRAEANKLIMLVNAGFRLSGFEPVDDARDGAVVFAFDLRASDVAASFTSRQAACVDADDDTPIGSIARLVREQGEEEGLDLCLGLALSTVFSLTSKFNAVAYGGASALEAAAAA